MTMWLGAGLLLWAGVVGGDGMDQCFKGSCQPGRVFYYEPGVTYDYLYEGYIYFYDDRRYDLEVTAMCQITAVSQCEMILTIGQVTLNSHEVRPAANPNFRRDLRARDLRFSFVDGVVQTICPRDGETLWSLNFKRAILSLFQNSAGSVWFPKASQGYSGYVTETEVTGQCTNKYTIGSSKGNDGLLVEGSVTSTRVGSCLPPSVPPTDVVLSSFLQILPLLRTTKTCASKLLQGALKSSRCTENFKSSWDSADDGPYIVLSNSLSLMNKKNATDVTSYGVGGPVSLTMEFQVQVEAPDNWITESAETITQIANNLPALDTAYDLFTKVRKFNHHQLQDLIIQTDAQHWELAVMLIVKMGTDASNGLLKEMLQHWDIADYELNEVILHIVNEYKMRNSLATSPYINDLHSSKNAFRTSMKAYCRQSSNCTEDKSLKRTMDNLLPTSDCSSRWGDEERSLRAWSRLGYLGANGEDRLLHCLNKSDSETRYRALELLQNIPCGFFSYETLLEYAKKSDRHTFMEAMMYLTLVRCPTQGLQPFLLDKLRNKEVNEQTSFIWSHLSNSNDEMSREVVRDEYLKEKYKPSVLRFSRNFHKTFELHNKTYTVDSNLVFENKKLTPKFITVKLTRQETEQCIVDLKIHQHKHGYFVIDLEVFEHFYLSKNINIVFFLDLQHHFFMSILPLITELVPNLQFGHIIQEVALHYPSIMGMPLHLKANSTTYFTPRDNHVMAAAGTNIQMSLDTPYTEVGRTFEASIELSSLASYILRREGRIKIKNFVFELPHARNSLIKSSLSQYRIKNGRTELSHVGLFVGANDVSHSHCLPWLQDQLGATICLTQYAGRTKEKSYSKYSSIDIVRDSSIKSFQFIVSDYHRLKNVVKLVVHGQEKSIKTYRYTHHHLNDLFVYEIETPNITVSLKGNHDFGIKNMTATGALRVGNVKGDFTFTGTTPQLSDCHYLIKSPFWGNIEVNSHYEKREEVEKGQQSTYTLTVPYNLKRWNITDSAEIRSVISSKPNRYEIISEMNLPFIQDFKFESSFYFELLFPSFSRLLLGGEVNLSVPSSGLTVKSDFSLINKILEHITSVSFQHAGQETKIVSRDSVKNKDEVFSYSGDLLVNEEIVFDVRSSYNQIDDVPFKYDFHLRVPSNQDSYYDYELTTTSEVDVDNQWIKTDVMVSDHGFKKTLFVAFGPSNKDEPKDGSLTGRLIISSHGQDTCSLAVGWELDPPSDFAVNASLRLPELSVESLSLQVEKEGPHVELTFIEMDREEEQTYAMEGVLG